MDNQAVQRMCLSVFKNRVCFSERRKMEEHSNVGVEIKIFEGSSVCECS